MELTSQERFAKVVLLAQRIYLNSQAMLTKLSRGLAGSDNRMRDPQEQLEASLKDLESCLMEFEQLTGIDLGTARDTLNQSHEALERGDNSMLYESVQRLYRDDYLGTIVGLSK